jgi:hypothetical protein
MLDREAAPKCLESGPTGTISREGYETPISRMGTLAALVKRGWRRRFCDLGAMAAMLILLLLVSANLAMSADWWRQGTVWKEFSHEQKLMYLKGYSAGFLAGAQQAFKDPEGLNNFYKSLAKITFRQGESIIDHYLENNPHKLGEPLGDLIFAAYIEAAKGASKAPEQQLVAKSAAKPSEIPAAQEVSKAPEKVPAPQEVPNNFEEINLGASGPSQLPKPSGVIKEAKKAEVQTETAVKGRVNPPLSTPAYTPPRESPERLALFVSLAQYMDPSKILRLSYVVQYLKVNNGWAWVLAAPQSKDGEIQYSPVYALLHLEDGAWKVKAYTRTEKGSPDFLISTGFLEEVKKRFPEAPPNIFQPEGD